MKGPRYHAIARAELREAAAYLDDRSPGLGSRFMQAIDEAVAHVLEYPQGAPADQRGVRKKVVKGFPYKLLYVLHNERILIVAVMHQNRRPGYWAWRVP